ncbi:hypothetical protein [Polaribacter atrinae]|uniref:hypothetical protein n=1 Tax=Polaribacter atrinae TaxID=1333662 RepID=UPI002491EB64|nr:hypothetical protein [Polaribacter atrinae]
MIDNHKVVTFNLNQINKIWCNTSLLYISDKDYRVRDEVRNVEVRNYKNLIFKKFYNRLEISGSIHYFFNNGLHNANDFNIIDCINTFKELIEYFKIKPKLFKVIGLEYGYNIQPIKEVNNILNSLRFYGRKKIVESLVYKNLYVSGTKHKTVKIYNKYQDCPLYSKPNTFRFEVKTNEKDFVIKLGIKTLEDLLNFNIYKRLSESILKEWQTIILFDFDLVEFKENHITEYWLDIIKTKHRNTFLNVRNKYQKDLPKNSIFKSITNQLKNKADEFINCAYSPTVKNSVIVHNRTITKSHYAQSTKLVKLCSVTGIGLNHEKKGSKYIKTTTLKHLRKFDKVKFTEVCNLLLSNSRPNHTKFEDSIISHLYKQIRNRHYNKNLVKNTGYNKKQYQNQYKILFQ